jgi:hypothetical protein
MRKNIIKQPKENKNLCLWQNSKRSAIINKVPVLNTVDDEEYFFEVEDF